MIRMIETITACSVSGFFRYGLNYFGLQTVAKFTEHVSRIVFIAAAINSVHYIVEVVKVGYHLWQFIKR